MIVSLTLPAIAFVAAISGLPTIPGLPGLKGVPMPASKALVKARAEATAADTLPPPWRPYWRQQLENSFLISGLRPIGEPLGPIRLMAAYDPRKLSIAVDPDSGYYRSTVEVGEVELGAGFRQPLSQFARDFTVMTFHQAWLENSRRNINSLGQNTPIQHPGISLPIPVRLPGPLTSWLGPGGPALNVSGSESIRLSGTSNWTNQELGVIGQRRSLFPSLDMQQDLDIRLEGQLSDRVKVNLLQNSANQVPLANRIAINYRGDEDDFVQSLDLGNTSLSLPGTQYVSYSGKNEGLFGVKFASRIGPLDFTALASKQEGRSERAIYTGGASVSKPPPFTDLDWVKGQYFLLYDPSYGSAYDIDQNSIRLYLDDANTSNDQGEVQRGVALIDPGHAFGLPTPAKSDTIRGNFNILNPGDDRQYLLMDKLYKFGDTTFLVVKLKQPIPITTNQTLAVTYRATPIIGPGHQLGAPIDVGGSLITTPGPDSGAVLMKLLRVPREKQQADSNGVFYDTTAVFAPVRELELKNVYNLGGFQIDPKSFKLTLQSGQGDPPVVDLGGIPLIEMVGLDSWDEQNDQARRGHDGTVDQTGYSSRTRAWVDYNDGTLFLPDARPFAPRLKDPGSRSFDRLLDGQVNRRRHLDGGSGAVNAPNGKVYDLYNPQTVNATINAQYYFNVEFAAARSNTGDITLGRGNLLENSEAVIVNGERWTRDRDYTIDYDLGRITLKRQLGPADQLSIDYSYAPLFAQASKTLVGGAFRLEGRDRSLGGAFLYESKGAQDIRPRLGEEPSRTLITDLNGEWRFKPSFLTRLADALPGVRTTTPSEFNIQAEGGMSFPNPNTRNEVFVDDMEGVRDAVSLSLTPDRWRWSSVPKRIVGGVPQSFLALTKQRNAEIHWYVPVSSSGKSDDQDLVHERDLRPRLSDGQGAQNVRTVLSLSIPRTPRDFVNSTLGVTDTMWAGLTYNLDAVGLDVSRSQFIELWVNDWNDFHDPNLAQPVPRVRGNGTAGSGVRLHLDLGRVSEDQMRAPNRPPNEKLDSEDRPPRDGQLTVVGGNSEDTGIDGVDDAGEKALLADSTNTGYRLADLFTANPEDPEGDDWGGLITNFPSAVDPRRYVLTNGTERSKDAFPIPDTEDMNLNGQPDTTEAYFEYTVDLADSQSPYLRNDIAKEFPVDPRRNGWRRYRIPLNDVLRVRFGSPDLTLVPHLRMWIEGLTQDEQTAAANRRPLLMLGGLDIVGSRWQSADLTHRQDSLQTTVTLNSVNSVDNADIYNPPFDPGTTRTGSQSFTRREQSIAMEFTKLQPGDTLEAFKTFSIPENYSRYGVLRWFDANFDVIWHDVAVPTDSGSYDPQRDLLYSFVRFASDDKGLNYYELKRRLPRTSIAPSPGSLPQTAWEEVAAELDKLSVVKLTTGFPTIDPILFRTTLANGDSLILKGRPSFTRLLRISIGLINQGTDRQYTGQFWFDELRATDVAKDVGLANRVNLNGRWANLMDYNLAWNSRDADFLSVGESRGTGSRNTSLTMAARFEPHRFFEGTGIQLPVSFTQSQSSSQPRFTAGDDIVRSGSLAAASETRFVSRSWNASYARTWSDRSNPLLRYTVGGITASVARTTNDARSPTALSNSTNVSSSVGYVVAPRDLLPVPLPFTKARFFPLPERFYWNYQMNRTESKAFTRLFGTDSLAASSSQNGRAASVDFGADSRPFDLLSHHIEGRRNLALDGVRLDRLGFVNFGRMTSWRQAFASHLAVNATPWVRPSISWSSNYSQNNDTQSPDLSARGIGNGQELGVNWDLPFDRLAGPGVTGVQAPRPQPAADSASRSVQKPRRPLPWRRLLAHLGMIGADGRIGRNSNYSRLTGTASPLYLIGLAENPGFDEGRVHSLAGNTFTTGIDWRGNARTTIPLAFGSSIQTRLSVGDRTNNSNGVKNRTRDWRFPDVEVQYGRVANVLGLSRFLDSPQLRTAFARSYSVDYQNSRENRSATSRSDDYRPLFSVRGRFHNGTDADFRLERRSSVRETFQVGSSKQTDQTTDINFSLTRSYSQGQKVNLLGKTTTVKTNVSLSLTTAYSRQKGGIKVAGFDHLSNLVDRTRLSVSGTSSYGFSNNVTGDLQLGFSHFRETNRIIRRSIRVEMRGQFRF